jgi:hypothetical protein
LLPHLHDEVVTIKGILTLLLTVRGQHSQH